MSVRARLRAGLWSGALLLFACAAGHFAGSAAASGDGTAPSYRIDTAHTGVQVDPALQLPLAKRWSVDFADTVSYPLIAEGKVFVTASAYPLTGTTLYALDQRDGHAVWSQPISGSNWWSAAAYDAGKIFVVDTDGLLRAFSAGDGHALWSSQVPGGGFVDAAPTAADGVVYVAGAGTGKLGAFEEADGHLIAMQVAYGGFEGGASPTLSDSSVFLAFGCQHILAFSRPMLSVVWQHFGNCSGGWAETAPYSEGRLYTWDYYWNLTFDATTGYQLDNWGWTSVGPPAVDGDSLWELSRAYPSNRVDAFDLPTRSDRWWFEGDGGLYRAPLVVDNGEGQFVFAASRSGMVYALDAADGTVRWTGNGLAAPCCGMVNGPTSELAAGQGLLVVPANNHLTAYGTPQPVQISNGPKAMEGDLKVPAGSTMKVGYSMSVPGKHPATQVSFSGAKVVFAYTCTVGKNAGTFSVAIADAQYDAAANDTSWHPTSDQKDPSSYQASTPVPDVCPAGSLVRLQKGGTFSAGIASSGANKISVRWHYSDNSPGKWSDTTTVVP